MGLDTRAYRVMTEDDRVEWVKETNEKGERPAFYGLAIEKLKEPVTLEDAPTYDQPNEMFDLPWPENLIGGMVSSRGRGSFRGKAYHNYIEAVTGHSLYSACEDPWIGPILEEIEAQLRRAIDSPPVEISNDYPGGYQPERHEREALADWFKVCVDNNLAVSGDY